MPNRSVLSSFTGTAGCAMRFAEIVELNTLLDRITLLLSFEYNLGLGNLSRMIIRLS